MFFLLLLIVGVIVLCLFLCSTNVGDHVLRAEVWKAYEWRWKPRPGIVRKYQLTHWRHVPEDESLHLSSWVPQISRANINLQVDVMLLRVGDTR